MTVRYERNGLTPDRVAGMDEYGTMIPISVPYDKLNFSLVQRIIKQDVEKIMPKGTRYEIRFSASGDSGPDALACWYSIPELFSKHKTWDGFLALSRDELRPSEHGTYLLGGRGTV